MCDCDIKGVLTNDGEAVFLLMLPSLMVAVLGCFCDIQGFRSIGRVELLTILDEETTLLLPIRGLKAINLGLLWGKKGILSLGGRRGLEFSEANFVQATLISLVVEKQVVSLCR